MVIICVANYAAACLRALAPMLNPYSVRTIVVLNEATRRSRNRPPAYRCHFVSSLANLGWQVQQTMPVPSLAGYSFCCMTTPRSKRVGWSAGGCAIDAPMPGQSAAGAEPRWHVAECRDDLVGDASTCMDRTYPTTHGIQRMPGDRYCGTSSLLVRRSTWDAFGGLDEQFFPAYYVDVDLQWG
jgi:GT2 family glycosyltransferase